MIREILKRHGLTSETNLQALRINTGAFHRSETLLAVLAECDVTGEAAEEICDAVFPVRAERRHAAAERHGADLAPDDVVPERDRALPELLADRAAEVGRDAATVDADVELPLLGGAALEHRRALPVVGGVAGHPHDRPAGRGAPGSASPAGGWPPGTGRAPGPGGRRRDRPPGLRR